jgi:hypothetical protein
MDVPDDLFKVLGVQRASSAADVKKVSGHAPYSIEKYRSCSLHNRASDNVLVLYILTRVDAGREFMQLCAWP